MGGGGGGDLAPLSCPIFFIFMPFSAKIMQNCRLTAPDLGFVRGGANAKVERGCQSIIWLNFPKNCVEMNTIKPGEGGRTSKISICRSATG